MNTINTPSAPSMLDAWMAEDADVIARLNADTGPGVARPDQVTHLTGIELKQAMFRGGLP